MCRIKQKKKNKKIKDFIVCENCHALENQLPTPGLYECDFNLWLAHSLSFKVELLENLIHLFENKKNTRYVKDIQLKIPQYFVTNRLNITFAQQRSKILAFDLDTIDPSFQT